MAEAPMEIVPVEVDPMEIMPVDEAPVDIAPTEFEHMEVLREIESYGETGKAVSNFPAPTFFGCFVQETAQPNSCLFLAGKRDFAINNAQPEECVERREVVCYALLVKPFDPGIDFGSSNGRRFDPLGGQMETSRHLQARGINPVAISPNHAPNHAPKSSGTFQVATVGLVAMSLATGLAYSTITGIVSQQTSNEVEEKMEQGNMKILTKLDTIQEKLDQLEETPARSVKRIFK
eukprot:maker-scaffold135_size322082-snap-gene-2.11 protein:Tk07972 transcript:maker-scaffold135_size322082-snap-gene-2.11-mRNA-1 annotation:"glycosyl hydrolase"